MMFLVTSLLGLALAGYVLVTVLLGRSLASGEALAPRASASLVIAAVALHAIGLAAYTVAFAEPPLVGLAPALSTLALVTGGFLLATCVFREPAPLGLILAPLIALLLGAALLIGVAPAGEPQAFHGLWLALHIFLAFIGYAGLAGAFAAGLLYLLQFRELKGKRFGRMFRFFPSLDTLDRWGRRALAIGFPALTLGLIVGWAVAIRFPETASVSSQIAWGVLTWLIFVAALAARLGGAGADRRGALASVLGFLLVLLSYVVLRLAVVEGGAFL